MDPIKLLVFNAGAQITFSSLFGVLMLIPLQPWASNIKKHFPRHALLAAHLDWIMLGLAQGLAAGGLAVFGHQGALLAPVLLCIGGWLNPVPYLFRGFGINAFVLGGPPKQVISALVAGGSSIAIIVGWWLLLTQWYAAF